MVEPVSESRSSIAFATEPLTGNLSQLVKKAQSYSSHDDNSGYDLDELEVRVIPSQGGKNMTFVLTYYPLDSKRIATGRKGTSIP